MMVFALTVYDGERESDDLDEVMKVLRNRRMGKGALGAVPPFRSTIHWWARGVYHRARIRATRWLCLPYEAPNNQILPVTSLCTRLAISTSRRQACSRNAIMRSMSRSLGSGISILRSPSATFGSALFQRVRSSAAVRRSCR